MPGTEPGREAALDFLLQIVFVSALILAVPALLYLLGRRFASRFFRRLAYETHLWLGVVTGLILFVVCLSGTLLTFKTETIHFLERDRYYVSVPNGAGPISLEELVPRLEQAHEGRVVRVTIPEGSDRSWEVNIKTEGRSDFTGPPKHSGPGAATVRSEVAPKEAADPRRGPLDLQVKTDSRDDKGPPVGKRASGEKPTEGARQAGRRGGPPAGMPAMHAALGTAYLVDPYTGESLGTKRSKVYMFFIMLQFLHRFLLLDIRTGQLIVGSATLIFVVLIVGGLFLWLPAKLGSAKAWKVGLKVRRGKGWNRFLYDTHNTLGFYALIPLLVMALTGPVISFNWYRNAMGSVLGTRPFSKSFEKPLLSDFEPGKQRNLSWDDFLAKADDLTERKGQTQIYLPQTPRDGVVVRKTGAGFCRIAATDKIQFDQYSGEVLRCELFDRFGFGEKVSTLIFPLHNGEIFGTVSKIVYFVACLIATTLPVTGVLLWIGKIRNRRKAARKRRLLEAEGRDGSESATSVMSSKHDLSSETHDTRNSSAGVVP